jgi:hypothetical protein
MRTRAARPNPRAILPSGIDRQVPGSGAAQPRKRAVLSGEADAGEVPVEFTVHNLNSGGWLPWFARILFANIAI